MPPSDLDRARQLIFAIDRGGIPLDKAIINRIAESFGLEVARTARTNDTIERIRSALKRCECEASDEERRLMHCLVLEKRAKQFENGAQ